MILRQVHGLKQIVFLAADSQAEDCRRQTSILSDASVQRLHEDAGQAWRQRKTREALLHATVGAAVGSDAIERGRHHDDSYLRPCSLEALQECKRKIAVQVALVEFVEDNRVDALEGWVGQQATGEDALRDKSQTRTRPDPLFETDLVADRSANLFVQFPGDSSGRQACRILRGSSTITSPLTRPRMAGGTRVVFAAPGGASMTRLGACCRDARSSGRIASTGSAGFRLTELIGTQRFQCRQCCSLRPYSDPISGPGYSQLHPFSQGPVKPYSASECFTENVVWLFRPTDERGHP